MTGGRAYLYDRSGRHLAALASGSVGAIRLSEALRTRADGTERFDELFELLQDHAAIGSELARRLALAESLAADTWLVEPVGAGAGVVADSPANGTPSPLSGATDEGTLLRRSAASLSDARDGGAAVPPSNAPLRDALTEELRR
jgi:hypothetical protein